MVDDVLLLLSCVLAAPLKNPDSFWGFSFDKAVSAFTTSTTSSVSVVRENADTLYGESVEFEDN